MPVYIIKLKNIPLKAPVPITDSEKLYNLNVEKQRVIFNLIT
jgi:hypothetical protein